MPAKKRPTKAPLVGDLVWSASKRAYFKGDRQLSDEDMAKLVHSISLRAADEVEKLTNDLLAGRINIPEWTIGMKEHIRLGHRAMALLSYGGKENMGPKEWGKTGNVVKFHLGYLRQFSSGLESGDIALNTSTIPRARMYMEALYATYGNFTFDREVSEGATEARRVLGIAHHCEDCPPLAALGWMSIKKIPPIGSTACRIRCRCRIETRTAT